MTRGVNPSPRRLPAVAPVFKDGYAAIPSAVPVQALINGIQDADEGCANWSDLEGTARPRYRHFVGRDGQGGVMDLSLRDGESEETSITEAMRAALWDQVSNLDDLTVDVLLVALARWLVEGDGEVWIDVDTILDDRGIKPMRKTDGRGGWWRAGHRRKDREEVVRAFEQLDRMYLGVFDVEVFGLQGNRRKANGMQFESKVIVISDRISQGTPGDSRLPVAWRYQPGKWVTYFVEGPSRQTALLARQSIRYDPYRQKFEKRLSRYLSIQWRIRASWGSYDQPFKVKTLFDAVGIKPDKRYPLKSLERLEGALDRLQQDGIVLAWKYEQWDAEKAPIKGWLSSWLQSTVVVTPVDALLRHYEHLKPSRKRALTARK